MGKCMTPHCKLVCLACDEHLRAQRRARDEGLVFVAPYDDPLTVAGQGTIGTEILRQVRCKDLRSRVTLKQLCTVSCQLCTV